MWIWIAYKFAKFYAERLNRSENIPKSCRGGLLFFKTPGTVWVQKHLSPEVFWNFFPTAENLKKKLYMPTVCWNLWQITRLYSIISKFDTVIPHQAHPSHTTCQTQDWLRANCTDFIAKDEWRPDSPDLNPLDCHVWGAMLQALYKLHSKTKTIPELKSALQQIWDDLPQTTINKAINDFRKRLNACASTGDGHLNRWYEYYTKIFRLNSVSETVINCLL